MHDSTIRVMVYESICLHFGKVSTDIERSNSLLITANAKTRLRVHVTSKRHQVLHELAHPSLPCQSGAVSIVEVCLSLPEPT